MLDLVPIDERKAEREWMVESQLVARGIRDRHVLDAIRWVPRENFLPAELADLAYDDRPLPIGWKQTISQPFMVAFMIEALKLCGNERVLEVGAGSGYAAAVLSRCAREVYSIEYVRDHARMAAERLAALRLENAQVLVGDGSCGLPPHAPYDAILVSAAAEDVPKALLEQLAPDGRLVIPVGKEPDYQILRRITHGNNGDFRQEDLDDVRFVPLVRPPAQ